MQSHFLTAVLFEALVGSALGVFLGLNGGWRSVPGWVGWCIQKDQANTRWYTRY